MTGERCSALLPLTLFQIPQFQHLFQFLKDILWSCRNSKSQGKTLPESFYSILVSTPGTFCCHVVGDLLLLRHQYCPELSWRQNCSKFRRVCYPPFQGEIQIMKILTDTPCLELAVRAAGVSTLKPALFIIFGSQNWLTDHLKRKAQMSNQTPNGHGEILHCTVRNRCTCRGEVSV